MQRIDALIQDTHTRNHDLERQGTGGEKALEPLQLNTQKSEAKSTVEGEKALEPLQLAVQKPQAK